MDASEREQYRAAIHGDREAFEMTIRTHSRTLFAIAYGILQSREEAEDAVQDSLVKAWKMRRRVRDPEKFPAWLCMIARHRSTLGTNNRTSRTRTEWLKCFGSTIAFRAGCAARASSRCAYPSLLRRDGLSDHRKHAGTHQWCAARNSR